ncbi:MAG: DUF3440 domain-containing protein [Culicoidibacterales bacterium]
MAKKYLDKNVYDAAIERINYIFDQFDNVLLAFSGGKDSGVMCELAIGHAVSTNQEHKLHLYHLDYEAQYQETTNYVERMFHRPEIPEENKWWLCLPVKAQCATSMFQNHWKPWEQDKKDIWVRDMPTKYVINEETVEFAYDDWDYVVQDNFSKWFANKHGKTCVLVGIRTQESLNRQAAITSKRKVNHFKKTNYIIKKSVNLFTGYPIYDWETEDIWVANAKFGWDYNKLYDLMYQAGLSIHEMRVASPFNDYAKGSLSLYKAIDPQTWGKMIGRVNGVNFTNIYGGTTAMGWKSITKPNHFTWEQYMYFLLGTLPEESKQSYLTKLETSIKFWKEKGGVLSEETIEELSNSNVDFSVGQETNYRTDKKPVRFESYPDDLPVTDFKSVPTYKRMCVCIMKNDHLCKYMGFSQTKNETLKRKEAVEKWKNLL